MEPYSTFTYLDGPLKGRTAPMLPAAKLDAMTARGVELHSVAFRAKGSELTERFEGFYRLERRVVPPPKELLPNKAPTFPAFDFVAIHVPEANPSPTATSPVPVEKKEEQKPFRVEITDSHPLAAVMKRLAASKGTHPNK